MNNKPKLRFKDKNGNAYPEWEEKAMEHFGTFLKGNNLSKADLTPNGYPCILYGELYTKYSEITEKIHSYTDRLETNQTIGNMNDVLIPSSGETAIDISTATCLLVNNVLLGGDLNVFRPKEQDGRFISYELNHKKRRKIASIAQGATVVHLYPNFLKKLKIILPCLEEQEKIAGFLSKVDELINECEGEVKDLEEQKKGLMQKIFSQQIRFKDSNNNPYPDWEYMPVGKVFDTITDFVAAGSFADLRKNVEYQNRPSYAQLIRTVDLKKKFQQDDAVYVNEAAFKFLWRVNLDENSLILPNIGANIGEVYYVTPNKLPYIHNVLGPNAILLKSSKNNLSYLYAYAQTDYFKKALFLQVGASGQPKFNKTDLKTIIVPIPYLEEQEKIAKVLSKMDELIEEKKALLIDLQQFKKGLLQQMFV